LQRLRNVHRENVRERRNGVMLHGPQHSVGNGSAGDLGRTAGRKWMNELNGVEPAGDRGELRAAQSKGSYE
jgi:hypothetical protein